MVESFAKSQKLKKKVKNMWRQTVNYNFILHLSIHCKAFNHMHFCSSQLHFKYNLFLYTTLNNENVLIY